MSAMWTPPEVQRKAELTMDSIRHPLLARLRRPRAIILAWLRKVSGVTPRAGDFASQRMCPFCSLITPRYEICCLECGRVLSPA
jgi:hypothetical protein